LLIREVEIRGIVGYKIGDEVFEVRELWEGSDVYLYSKKSQVFSDCRRTAGVNDDVDVCFVLAHILDNFQLLFYEPCAFSYLSYILLILREIWFCRGNHWDLIIVYKMQSSKAQIFMLCIGHRDLYLSSSKLCSAGRQFLPSVSFASSQGRNCRIGDRFDAREKIPHAP
jgi:hypothetical protein